MKNFLWTGDILKQKLVTVAWSNVCQSKAAGGLGIKDISPLNKAALLMHMWGILNTSSEWSSFVRSRFHISHLAAPSTYKVSSIRCGLKAALSHIQSHS